MPERNPAPTQIVWRHLHRNAIPLKDANPEPSHLPCHRREHVVPIAEAHAERRAGEHLADSAFEFDRFFLRHGVPVSEFGAAPGGPARYGL